MRYKIEVWRKVTKTGVRYYHHLLGTVPKINVLETGVHKSRQGRSARVKRIKEKYKGIQVYQVKKPTKTEI